VFDGVSVGDIGVYLRSSESYPVSVSLKGLALFSSIGPGDVPFFNEEKPKPAVTPQPVDTDKAQAPPVSP
jgi:hypothetical protein